MPASGLLVREALADGRQHRHVHVGPFDAQHAFGGEADVFDVVPGLRAHSMPSLSPVTAAATMPQATTGIS